MANNNNDNNDMMSSRHMLNEERRVNTSVNIDENMWKEMRMLAIERNTTATELLGTAISEYLARQKNKR